MATNKTITPTNVTVSIPAMSDAPDQSVNSNCIDKLIDAVNKVNTKRSPAIGSIASDTEILSFDNGAYQISLSSSSPYVPTQWGTLIVNFSGSSYGAAIFISSVGGLYIRHKKNNSEWHDNWARVDMNVQTSNVLSLDSNVVNTSDANSATVKANKIVQVRCQFKFKTTPTVGTEYTIGTLPAGYRPAIDTWYATSGTGGAWASTDLGVVTFKTNGNVTVTPRGVATSNWYMFNATFIAA